MPFFADLVMRTDEARRDFETNPVVLDAVAHGMNVERYRRLLLELYHVVWHFNPVCAAAASRMPDPQAEVRYFLYEHMHEESGHEQWVLNDLEAVGGSTSMLMISLDVRRTVPRTPSPWLLATRRSAAAVAARLVA